MITSLMIIAIISVIATSLIDRQRMTMGLSKSDQIDSVASKLQQSLIASIYNNSSWSETADGSNCALSGDTCGADDVETEMQLRDTSGAVLADSTVDDQGFDRWGNPCGSFDAANGNDACPFRYNLTWSPVFRPDGTCPATGCPIRVNGALQFRPATNTMGLINPARYEINVVRGREAGSLREMCAAINGVFNQISDTCELPTAATTQCPAGFYLLSSPETGALRCLPLATTSTPCPLGSGAVGFNNDGSLNCQSILSWDGV